MGVNQEDSPGDVDAFLAHYGVLGMKWGKRKAKPSRQESRANKRQVRENRRVSKGRSQIARAGGDYKLAVRRRIGRSVINQLLVGTATSVAVGSLSAFEVPEADTVAKGAAIAGNLVGYGVLLSDINKGVDLRAAGDKDGLRVSKLAKPENQFVLPDESGGKIKKK